MCRCLHVFSVTAFETHEELTYLESDQIKQQYSFVKQWSRLRKFSAFCHTGHYDFQRSGRQNFLSRLNNSTLSSTYFLLNYEWPYKIELSKAIGFHSQTQTFESHCSMINSTILLQHITQYYRTTGKYYSIALVCMVTVNDFIHKLER